MELYYHNVGSKGAGDDFPKTVFRSVPISVVRENVPDDRPYKAELLKRLRLYFPEGEFNCWGVPERAYNYIKKLSVGDVVLLLETLHNVPAMGEVVAFWPDQLPKLSEALWGKDRFPYIFFFRTERLSNLTWEQMRADFGYDSNYKPPNYFLPVRKDLSAYGGAERYVAHLREHFGVAGGRLERVTTAELEREAGESDESYRREVEEESSKIIRRSLDNPQLTEGAAKRVKRVTERPRSAAFRLGVKKLYEFRCAICGLGLVSPDGAHAVESAHIYPKEHDGSDDYRNGVCLCHMHHWAFDAGWLAISDDLRVLIRDDLPAGEDYDFIRRYEGEEIALPTQKEFSPSPLFLRAHRRLKEFE